MRHPLRWSIGLAIASFALVSEAQIASPPAAPHDSVSQVTTQSANSTEAKTVEVWSHLRQNRYEAAKLAADQLLQLAPNNSLGLVANAAANWQTHADDASALSYSKRALRFANDLQRPGSMSEDEFAQMVKTVRALADHIAGDVYRMRGDVVSARKYLKESVALEPNNGTFAYSAALGYLNGKNPDPTTGYWLLARSVNLTRSAPDGNDIAEFARQTYEHDGGTSAHWDQYVASAAATSAPPVVHGAAEVETAQTNAPAPAPSTTATKPPTAQQGEPAESQSQPVLMASARTIPDTPERAPMKVPDLPPEKRKVEPLPERKPLRVFREGAPISLGIVIEASIASKANRSSVVYTLSDMVRGLRENDEAFVESYGDKVTFGQDLTWNYELLEQAMDQISPDRGTSMLDAVGFAANHLRRIAKNENRVLFVISDGTESGKQAYPESESMIRNSGVRIVCLGIGVSDPANRDRLRELASTTGGQVMFIDSAGEFRSAAHQIASAFGLRFQE